MAIGSTILVKDVLFRVSTILQDIVGAQFVRWTEKELIAWLNDGQRAICKYMPIACNRIDAIKLVPGTRQSIAYIPAASILQPDGNHPAGPVRGLMLIDVIRNMGEDGLTPGLPIRVTPRETLDNINALWHTQSGTTIDHFTFDPRLPETFYVMAAVPAATPVWAEIAYAANPDEIPYPGATSYAHDGASTTTISVEDKFVDDLVNYVLARAFQKDSEYVGNAANGQFFTTMFISSLNAQVQALTGQNPNLAFLPFAPQFPASAR